LPVVGNFWHLGIRQAHLRDAEAWREATQLIAQFGEQALAQALLRSLGALEVGNTSESDLWHRIAIAVQEVKRTKPDGEDINSSGQAPEMLDNPDQTIVVADQ